MTFERDCIFHILHKKSKFLIIAGISYLLLHNKLPPKFSGFKQHSLSHRFFDLRTWRWLTGFSGSLSISQGCSHLKPQLRRTFFLGPLHVVRKIQFLAACLKEASVFHEFLARDLLCCLFCCFLFCHMGNMAACFLSPSKWEGKRECQQDEITTFCNLIMDVTSITFETP